MTSRSAITFSWCMWDSSRTSLPRRAGRGDLFNCLAWGLRGSLLGRVGQEGDQLSPPGAHLSVRLASTGFSKTLVIFLIAIFSLVSRLRAELRGCAGWQA